MCAVYTTMGCRIVTKLYMYSNVAVHVYSDNSFTLILCKIDYIDVPWSLWKALICVCQSRLKPRLIYDSCLVHVWGVYVYLGIIYLEYFNVTKHNIM